MKTLFLIRRIIILLIVTICFNFTLAQNPVITWQKTIGGSGDDYVNFGRVFTLSDGNYMIVGTGISPDGDFSGAGNQGSYDAFAVKFSKTGALLWVKTYGGTGDDILNAVVEETNGNYTLAGFTTSDDGDVSGNHGGLDGWVISIDANGNLLSQKCYGGSGDDQIRGMMKTSGNQYVIAGMSDSDDGDVAGNHGDSDAWVAKLGQSGNVIWSDCYGGSSYEYISGIIQTNTGKLIVAGTTGSADGIMSSNHGGDDGFAFQLNQAGTLKWSKCFGGSSLDVTQYGIEMSSDGHLVLPMLTLSDDGDATENHGSFDMLVLKINSSTGGTIWSHCYGSSLDEGAFGAMALPEGELILLGVFATDGNINATYDAAAVKVDANGNEIWTKTFGGSDFDDAEDGVVTQDGDFLLLCHTASYDGDVTNQHGPFDIWLVNLKEEDELISFRGTDRVPELTSYPNPCNANSTISFDLNRTENLSLKVFNVSGDLVMNIADGELGPGQYQFDWNTSEIKPGMYLLRLETGSFTEVTKIFVTR